MLPLLQHLSLSIQLATPEIGYLLVLSPSLQTLQLLRVPWPKSEFLVESRMDALFRFITSSWLAADTLTHVRAMFQEAELEDVYNHMVSMGHCRDLQKLDIGISVVSHATLRAISSLGYLRTLALLVTSEAWTDHHDTESQPVHFLALDSLSLRGTSSDIKRLLLDIHVGTLRSLTVILDDSMDAEELRQLLQFFVNSLPTVTGFHIHAAAFTPTSLALTLSQILEPVLAHRAVTDISCRFKSFPSEVSDADISAMSTAWPNLRTLSIVHDDYISMTQGTTPSVNVTIAGLVILVRNCPSLEKIKLSRLDPSGNPLPDLSHILHLDDCRVREVEIGQFIGWYYDTVDIAELAAFFDCLFPRLDVIRPVTMEMLWRAEKYTVWEIVQTFIAAIRVARSRRGGL